MTDPSVDEANSQFWRGVALHLADSPKAVHGAATIGLAALAAEMRANSERWFPRWHSPELGMPLTVAYALGLAGEVGEVANVVKKMQRDGDAWRDEEGIGAELADVFTYLLLLADEYGVDLVAEYRAKVEVNEARWGAGANGRDAEPDGG